jgi:hypothetical protein|tara:strand:+ start:4399 stop:4782 length:384 start_codon:yes stop_codon:yes gene_type:complete
MSKPNEKIEKIALDILGSQELPKDKFGSILMVLMMISIILTAMRVLQECNKNKKDEDQLLVYKQHIKEICEYRGWFPKMKLRKLMRKELSHEDYRTYARPLVRAIFDKGARITDDEVLTLLETLKND